MPNFPIENTPPSNDLTGEELTYVTQGGNSRRMTVKNVARPGIHRGPTAPSNPDINDLWATLTVVPPTPLYAADVASGVPTVEFEGQTYEPLPAVTNLLTAPFDQTNPAYELFPPEGVQITSGIADPFGGNGAFRIADMSGFAYIVQYYESAGDEFIFYNDIWMRMVSAGGGTGLSADVGLYHARADWVEVTLDTAWNWYRVPRIGRPAGQNNTWGINLQNNTVIEIYHARAFIDDYNNDPTYQPIIGPY